ncbi:unnamed protein product [Penicillium salamii]|uniref:F-box domain-containing protein n=1 Tax=Penicillium salamii TaxID=1612424 RepID=A0A9W4P0D0_9EURO|nr:unnamed protein product [Penicillium salamii]CAG8137689.1 unnamed protein product [Penicillium salamii]CAG8362049.1 unnamed protein product [Penicillium salamii]CAG8408170.1 unnamed protein product [Penicillium salamii]CAG8410086.1 unnamed protein product [Penicillium salamii]
MGPSDSSTNNQCSRLESLPVEILQLIFLHSLEVNLPRASPRLGNALSSPLLYTWLIRLVFSSPNPGSREGFFTPDFLPPPLDFWALSWEERAHLQTTLLACRWCTFTLLRKCQREYVNHAIRRKCTGLVFREEDQALLSNLDPRFDDLEDRDWAPDMKRGKGDIVFPAQLEESLRTPSSRSVDRKVAIWFHYGAFQIREPNEIFYENDLFRLPCANVIKPGRIPDKVLRSPWSDAQFWFLQLLSSDFYLDEDQFSLDRSSDITYRLIRKRKFEPFRRLLSMSFRSGNCRVPARWPLQPVHYSLVRRYGSGSGDRFINFILEERWDDIPVEVKQELLRYVESP